VVPASRQRLGHQPPYLEVVLHQDNVSHEARLFPNRFREVTLNRTLSSL
jgi:hypothetical protein